MINDKKIENNLRNIKALISRYEQETKESTISGFLCWYERRLLLQIREEEEVREKMRKRANE